MENLVVQTLPKDVLGEIYRFYESSYTPKITEVWVRIYDKVCPSKTPIIELNGKKIALDFIMHGSDSQGAYSWYKAFPMGLTIKGCNFPKLLMLEYPLMAVDWNHREAVAYSDDVGYRHGATPTHPNSRGSVALSMGVAEMREYENNYLSPYLNVWTGDFCIFFDVENEQLHKHLP